MWNCSWDFEIAHLTPEVPAEQSHAQRAMGRFCEQGLWKPIGVLTQVWLEAGHERV